MEKRNRQFASGMIWNLIGLFFSRGALLVTTLLLARLLPPKTFGLLAMIHVVIEFANVLIESGMGQAIIRDKDVTRKHLDTAFTFNVLVSLVCYAIIYLTAPMVAAFYDEDQLTLLLRVTGIVVLINAFRLVQTAVLSKQLNFRTQTKASTIAYTTSGAMAIVAAYSGMGVWSLTIQILTSTVLLTALLWVASDYRPQLSIDPEAFHQLFKYSSGLLADGIFSKIYSNAATIVIGRFFSAETAGLYYFSHKVTTLITLQITRAFQQVSFPAMANLQNNNKELLQRYRQVLQILMFIITPILLVIAGCAETLVAVAISNEWKEAVPYLQVLCIVAVIYPINSLNVNILKVKGKISLLFKIGIVKKSVGLTILVLAIPFGVTGIVFAQLLSSVFALIPNMHFAKTLIKYRVRDQALDALKPIFAAVLASVATHLICTTSQLSDGLKLGIGVSCGMIVYLVVSFVIRSPGLIIALGQIRRISPQWAR